MIVKEIWKQQMWVRGSFSERITIGLQSIVHNLVGYNSHIEDSISERVKI